MNKKLVGIIIFCLCFLAVSNLHAAESKLPTLDAKQLQTLIDSNKGKVIFINFFATWCPPCREEIPGLISLSKHYKESDVIFLGLSIDQDLEVVEPFIKDMGISYPVYHANNDVSFVYGIRSIPHNVIYDHRGILVTNAPGNVREKDIKNFIDKILEAKN